MTVLKNAIKRYIAELESKAIAKKVEKSLNIEQITYFFNVNVSNFFQN